MHMMRLNTIKVRSFAFFCATVILLCGSLNVFCQMIPNAVEASSLPAQHDHRSSDDASGCFDSIVSPMAAWQTDLGTIPWESSPLSLQFISLGNHLEVYSQVYLPFDSPPRYLLLSTFLI